MSLRLPAIDRLFDRLAATYGAGFARLYGTVDAGAAKTAWAHELAGFDSEDGLRRIAWALEQLPESCPNAIQFRNLCRSAPMPQAPKLPQPEPDPARMSAEMAKLRGMLAAKPAAPMSGVDWARKIMARVAAGEKVATATQAFAREALARKGCVDAREVGHA